MKNNYGCSVFLFCFFFIFIKHVLFNPKALPSIGYGIGVIGLIGAALVLCFSVFKAWVK